MENIEAYIGQASRTERRNAFKMRISELPEDVELSESFGSYSLHFEVKDNTIFVKRSIKLQSQRVTLEDYSVLESFYQKRIKADQSTVVLERS
ncbi:hypothetical protein F7C95_15695 [Opitutia bacterium ISCC 51]|nr:hypothetical protein F7C95_15695 [Opitutae bacterium ISCC 51]QXD27426.1 hypothetical protein GA003_15595 [Opitutae bacterium ISCC 52]